MIFGIGNPVIRRELERYEKKRDKEMEKGRSRDREIDNETETYRDGTEGNDQRWDERGSKRMERPRSIIFQGRLLSPPCLL